MLIGMIAHPVFSAILSAHFPRVKKVHVVIEYGKPIYPKELDKETRKHLGIYCHDLIQYTIKKKCGDCEGNPHHHS